MKPEEIIVELMFDDITDYSWLDSELEGYEDVEDLFKYIYDYLPDSFYKVAISSSFYTILDDYNDTGELGFLVSARILVESLLVEYINTNRKGDK